MKKILYYSFIVLILSVPILYSYQKINSHDKLFMIKNVFNKKVEKITEKKFLNLIPKDIPKEYHKILLETAVYESELVAGAKQKNGVALGIMQIEPATHQDIYNNYLVYRPELMERLKSLGSYTDNDIRYNTPYAIYVAYILYRRNIRGKEGLLKNKHGRAVLYKTHYNTTKGKGELLGYIYGR